MVIDPNLIILYVNPALRALLVAIEDELRQDLPRFNASQLIGSSLDIFHIIPADRREVLTNLVSTHRATINVGRRSFDLIMTPIDECARRVGFVLELSDAGSRLLNADYAEKMIAASRTQAIVEFTPEGVILDANEVFLATVEYSIEELRGRHHSMLVEPQYGSSKEYISFWKGLEEGEFKVGRFKRRTKSGSTIWVEGAYNPIPDVQGKIVKVLKFATDVTKQGNLLAELYSNFEEMDGAIQRSEHDGRSAALAADATLSRVRSVAAGTQELAACIGSLTGTMSQSQSAADQAVKRAVSVGESTSKLAAAAREMSGIVDLIRSVAGQINLLALNATIEAARAGDAGKGFAVVAAEVKNLAKQSADATVRIAREIESIQATSTDVAGAADTIRDTIKTVHDHVSAGATLMRDQQHLIGTISSEMQSAAETVSATTRNISGIAVAIGDIAQGMGRTKQAAKSLAS